MKNNKKVFKPAELQAVTFGKNNVIATSLQITPESGAPKRSRNVKI